MTQQEIVKLVKKEISLATAMAGKKLSEFTDGGLPTASNYICAANAGVNEKYLLSNIALANSTETNIVYFSTNGVDDSATHNGSAALPFQTLEFARQECKLRSPSASNVFTILGDGNNYFVQNLTISPFINYDLNGGILTIETVTADPDWAIENGSFNFVRTQLEMLAPGLMSSAKKVEPKIIDYKVLLETKKSKVSEKVSIAAVPVFDLNISTNPTLTHSLIFNITIVNDFDFNFLLTDTTFCLFNNIYNENSSNVVYVDNGNFFYRSSSALNLNYSNSSGETLTQLGILNSVVINLHTGTINPSATLQLVTFGSFIVNYEHNNPNTNIFWIYDSISYRTPSDIDGLPTFIPITLPESINTTVPRVNYTPVPNPVTGAIDLESEFEGIDTALAGGIGTGDVKGPASAVNDNIATYDGTTGKIIKENGVQIIDEPADNKLIYSNGKKLIIYGDIGAAITSISGNVDIDAVDNITLSADLGNIFINADKMTQKTLHSTTWQGIWASPQSSTGDVYYTKIGDQIFLDLPALVTANANTPSFITATTVLPANIRPPLTLFWAISIRDNGTRSVAFVEIVPSGAINIYANSALGNFSGLSLLGQSGFFGTTVRYFI